MAITMPGMETSNCDGEGLVFALREHRCSCSIHLVFDSEA